MIYRVETRYGCRDYHTLEQAKRNSKEGDYIKLVIWEIQVLSRVKRKYATPSWVRRVCDRYCYDNQQGEQSPYTTFKTMTTDYIVGWADQMYRTPENKTEGIYKIYQYWEDALDDFLSVLSNNPRKGRLLLISEK